MSFVVITMYFILHILIITEKRMNRIQNGWFAEINEQWPGQALSLEVEEILYEGKSKYQDILVFKRYYTHIQQLVQLVYD